MKALKKTAIIEIDNKIKNKKKDLKKMIKKKE